MYDAFGTASFDELYVAYEADDRIPRKTIGAQELILALLKERAETGRLYIMNIDHCNSHRSSKSLKQLSDVALKMASVVDQRLSTSQSGTKK